MLFLQLWPTNSWRSCNVDYQSMLYWMALAPSIHISDCNPRQRIFLGNMWTLSRIRIAQRRWSGLGLTKRSYRDLYHGYFKNAMKNNAYLAMEPTYNTFTIVHMLTEEQFTRLRQILDFCWKVPCLWIFEPTSAFWTWFTSSCVPDIVSLGVVSFSSIDRTAIYNNSQD